ncbi:hypothetical protein BSL78_01936 [Apostichopus japonicus]|uniref:EGF-like domain-containing protein n=1 Tax=Stichopus japonicus TaxID=307972 RepID=A0A2G8LLH7_STIJA|nr:hypothetical protein BSL78_01936 [Apostichopus japonicus]
MCVFRGCPGTNNMNCTNRGLCNQLEQTCFCDSKWKGLACELPNCEGTPDCNAQGDCILVDGEGHCECYEGWIGPACNVECIQGTQDPDYPSLCVCEPCYSGDKCDIQCSGQGSCIDSACVCESNYKGDDCSELNCPGEPDCLERGSCVLRDDTALCLCGAGLLEITAVQSYVLGTTVQWQWFVGFSQACKESLKTSN